MKTQNNEQKKLMACAQAIYETVKESGGIPSGHAYAAMMSLISLDEYNYIISALKKADLIDESGFYLTLKKKADQ